MIKRTSFIVGQSIAICTITICVPLIYSLLPFRYWIDSLLLTLLNYALCSLGIVALVAVLLYGVVRDTLSMGTLQSMFYEITLQYLPNMTVLKHGMSVCADSVRCIAAAAMHADLPNLALQICLLCVAVVRELIFKVGFLFTCAPYFLLFLIMRRVILRIGFRVLWTVVAQLAPTVACLVMFKYLLLPASVFEGYTAALYHVLQLIGLTSLVCAMPLAVHSFHNANAKKDAQEEVLKKTTS